MRLIIHCGMSKSGTTAVQRFLSANQERLLRQGVLYPDTGRYKASDVLHNAMFYSICKDRGSIRTPLSTPPHSFDQYVDLLKKEVSTAQPQVVILSSEMLFNPVFNVSTLEEIRDALGFADLTMYCVLRDQADRIESSFAQGVTGPQKSSETPSQKLEYIQARRFLDYEERLAAIESVFGKERLKVCWYDDIKRDVMAPLRKLAGFEADREFVRVAHHNKRQTWFGVRFCRVANSIPNERIQTVGRRIAMRADAAATAVGLQPVLDSIFAPYSNRTKQQVRARYSEANARITNAYQTNWWRA